MIYIKTREQIEILREAGKISREILDCALGMCKPGISTGEIDAEIEIQIEKAGAIPWFKEVDNYPNASCISINNVWLHGIPGDYILKVGDVVSIDLGVKYSNMYVDNCWTIVVQEEHRECKDLRSCFFHKDKEITDFLKVGVSALESSIEKFIHGNRVGDISSQMQKIVEDKGYSVIDGFGGHGVGVKQHEDPHVPCTGTSGTGSKLKKGMVLAIEIMHAMGAGSYEIDKDGWSVLTGDGKVSGMFEHTVALTENGPEILTS